MVILFIELLFIVVCNVIYFSRTNRDDARIYRVEAKRVAQQLQESAIADIDLSEYKTIVRVSQFQADEVCNNDYVVEEIKGVLYRIEYKQTENSIVLIYANIGMGITFGLTIIVLIYVWKKIVKPFHNMSDLTYELAKGNLATPVKEEKSKFIGKFLWGMDMLRDNLESKKQKELELQKEKKTLILSLSHDIKTPLSAIELYSKALSADLYDTKEEKEVALKGITRNVNEIKQYVDEIVTASRENFLHLEVKLGEFYYFEVLNTIENYYRDRLSVIHTEFIVEEMDNCLLQGDVDRIIEVLQNIMENAIKYGDGKQIRISCLEEEDCRLIIVGNTGCTLKKEELPHLFDSFYRGSNSQGVKGSGLGLYICKSLMRKMNGEIFAKVKDDIFQISVVIRKA